MNFTSQKKILIQVFVQLIYKLSREVTSGAKSRQLGVNGLH